MRKIEKRGGPKEGESDNKMFKQKSRLGRFLIIGLRCHAVSLWREEGDYSRLAGMGVNGVEGSSARRWSWMRSRWGPFACPIVTELRKKRKRQLKYSH